ncbi:TonB-dependent receptor [Emticicia fluvialis]|uniref:TonB-dependent receptor n=1 Tax=Emticicia fluvialis TaxID=2974474 RepID=UPI002165EA66|nr:TonB-dependent receptor [Emticicia fluvialis]
MTKLIPYILFYLFLIPILKGQTNIKGKVTDKKGEAIPGANIYIKGSYDGATSDAEGGYLFRTSKKDTATLVASFVGYDNYEQKIKLAGGTTEINIRMQESMNVLNMVTITAGTFEASDSKKMVMLKPLDIVTTAGGGADITAVMQLLSGAQRVGEQEGLFVRGGSANETKTVIDGMIVQNPFFSSTPDVPQRGRFTPFMFKGTAFSTGGYSAQYGQALSSVLLLQTRDKTDDASGWNINANMAGLGATYTHKGSISGSLYYTNLTPFFNLMKSNIEFDKVPQGLNTSLTINENLTKNSNLKIYGSYAENQSIISFPNYQSTDSNYKFNLKNKNLFTNGTYQVNFDEGRWILLTGLSYSRNTDKIKIGNDDGDRLDERTQIRTVLTRLFGKNYASSVLFGAEFHAIKTGNIYNQYDFSLQDNYSAAFTETELYITPKLAGRLGMRAEYTSAIDKANIAPRVSLAYKTGQYSQVSLAAGQFYQTPEKNYLYLNRNLDYELANHLILNYQIIKNDRTFRMEGFRKDYKNLVLEHTSYYDPNPYRFPTGPTDNKGKGFAQGFDIFYRDKKSIKSGEFWLTYSFLDTERLFRNYQKETMPTFASKHNVSVVYKQFFEKISTNAGVTFTHTSGRPNYDFATTSFAPQYTRPYENVSLSASHIRTIKGNFMVFYATLDNLFARKNVFGYRYSADGKQRFEVIPPMYRTFFLGVSINLSKQMSKPKEADLDNL